MNVTLVLNPRNIKSDSTEPMFGEQHTFQAPPQHNHAFQMPPQYHRTSVHRAFSGQAMDRFNMWSPTPVEYFVSIIEEVHFVICKEKISHSKWGI